MTKTTIEDNEGKAITIGSKVTVFRSNLSAIIGQGIVTERRIVRDEGRLTVRLADGRSCICPAKLVCVQTV